MNESIVFVNEHVSVMYDEYRDWYQKRFNKPSESSWLKDVVCLSFIRWYENQTEADGVMAWVQSTSDSRHAIYVPIRFVSKRSRKVVWVDAPSEAEAIS